MSAITVGTAPLDLTAAATARSSVSTDPDAFAAELQSATNSTASAPDGSSAAAASAPPAATASVPASIAGPDGAPPVSLPTAAPTDPSATGALQPGAPKPAVPVGSSAPVSPDLAAADPAASDTATGDQATVPPTDAGQGIPATVANSPAPVVAVAAPIVQVPTAPVHRGPRHASASDTLAAPIPAVAGAPLPSAATPVAPSTPVSLPAATTPDGESSAVAAATVALSAAAPVRNTAGADVRSADDEDGTTASTAAAPAPALPVPVLPTLESAPPVAATAAIGAVQRPNARISTAPNANPQDFAAALAAPSVTHTASAEATSAPAAPQTPQPLNEQLAPPLLALRTAGAGTHVLTLTVSPDSVGPVTVRAHVSGDTMRVELSAPTAQGTDALKSMLPDLKRDLAQGGMSSALTIASPHADSSAAGGQNPFGGAGGSFARDDRPSYFRGTGTATVPASGSSPRLISVGATSALDVLA